MKTINLRDLYPDVYKTDTFVEVTEEVLDVIQATQRLEAAYERRMYRHKAHYSLDCGNGIEKAAVFRTATPEDIFEEKQQQERLYAAVMALPEKQAKRLYAHFYLGMTPVEIAHAEGGRSKLRPPQHPQWTEAAGKKSPADFLILCPFAPIFVSTYKKAIFLPKVFDN